MNPLYIKLINCRSTTTQSCRSSDHFFPEKNKFFLRLWRCFFNFLYIFLYWNSTRIILDGLRSTLKIRTKTSALFLEKLYKWREVFTNSILLRAIVDKFFPGCCFCPEDYPPLCTTFRVSVTLHLHWVCYIRSEF